MAAYFLNALGEMCPLPNMMVRAKLKEIGVGEVVTIETDHSCAKTTLVNEMKKLGHRVSVKQVEPGVWQISVRRER